MPDPLWRVLETARAKGLLGPGPLEVHITQALGFGERVPNDSTFVDLGSGGGVPGLPLLVARPDLSAVLVDTAKRRVKFLQHGIEELGLGDRVSAMWGRAEDLARESGYRECFDAVLSRSFGPPAVVAECARGFLRPGGRLIVSEPPDERGVERATRWPTEPLREIGLEVGSQFTYDGFGFQELLATDSLLGSIPRRAGIPSKRPLF